jgi:methionyl-tRNA formyltransferase
MNVALVGNNDGPLVLARSMQAYGDEPGFVGLQNPPDPPLADRYASTLGSTAYIQGFDEPALLDALASADVDLVVNSFCNFRFRKLLDAYEVLNVHPSPLPRYRGRHPIQWALLNGEPTFGITVHRMAADWDAGAILWQASVPVDDGMSVRALRRRLLDALEDDFGAFLPDYTRGDVSPRPNPDADATYVARRRPADSEITRWTDRDAVYRKVNAFASEDYPAFFTVGDDTYTARSARRDDRRYVGLAAPFVCGIDDASVRIACLDGHTLWLDNLDPPPSTLTINQRLGRGIR